MDSTAQSLGADNGTRRYQLSISGRFTPSQSGKTFESVSPHDCSVVAVVAEGDKPDIDAAVAAARGAYEGVWSATPPGSRASLRSRSAIPSKPTPASPGRPRRFALGCPVR